MVDSGKLIFVLKCMLAAYILTAGLLLLLALMLYRFGLSEKTVSICIIVIYKADGREKIFVGPGHGLYLFSDSDGGFGHCE